MKTFIKGYIHKKIDFKFHGMPLLFFTSQELFSSFDLDQGSKLLLYSIGKKVSLEHKINVLDAGCGIGTLGVSLKSYKPDLQVDFIDRDALALLFTEYNSAANNLPRSACFGSLGINQLPVKKYDLVVSNIPAKAGNPVIEQMIKGYGSVLTENGLVAIVIVGTLADFAERIILKHQGNLLHKSVTGEYTVFHYNGLRSRRIDTSLEPYVRGTFNFRVHNTDYLMRTVYGLPDFDHLGYAAELSIHLLNKSKTYGSVLVQNPGHGYIPLFMLSAPDNNISRVCLAGRDLLSLLISELNITENLKHTIHTYHIPYLRHLEERFDFIIINYVKETVSSSHILLMEDLKRLLSPNGEVIVTGKSMFLFRFNSLNHGFKILQDVKRRGYRGCHYRKN